MPQVKIGPSFFAKAKADYADWRFAWAREILQNSCDAAGTTKIDVSVNVVGENVQVVVENNGEPMSEDILVDKLLALGESGKADQSGVVGAFGKAKELLYYSNLSYTIKTGENLVTGSGGDYEITKLKEPIDGTISEVFMVDESLSCNDLAESLVKKFSSIIYMTQRPWITFTVNGNDFPANLKKGSKRRAFTWGTVYTNKSFSNRLIVRIGGMPMFTKYVELDRCVVLELDGSSTSVLQSNRDGLQYRQQGQLDEFLRKLAVDKRSALEEPTTSYLHYDGKKLGARGLAGIAKENIHEILTAAYANVQDAEDARDEDEETGPLLEVDHRPMMDQEEQEVKTVEQKQTKIPAIGHEFIIKNELGMVIPEHLLPEAFSAYSQKLVKYWATCLLEIHKIFGNTESFAIGFVLSAEVEAQCETNGPYGDVFYISPSVVKLNSFGGRSLARRWKFTPSGKMAILSVALHEFAHRKYDIHNEDYSNYLTELTGVLLKNVGRFHRCFR